MSYRHWQDVRSLDETHSFVLGLVVLLRSRVGSSCLLDTVVDLVKSKDYAALSSLDFSYEEHDVDTVRCLRQILAFFEKRPDLPLAINRADVALRKFEEAEALCGETNQVFDLISAGKFSFLRGVESVLFTAQRKIAKILGPIPSLEVIKPRFGPGATTQVRKSRASARVKLSQKPACSTNMSPFARIAIEQLGGWFYSDARQEALKLDVLLDEGRASFVPKNALTDRTVVVEPMLNTMFQLGYGDYIARRLKRAGVDIRSQERNKNLACLGSLSGDLATLDLSSASDTVSRELVFALLPHEWAHRLSCLRTVDIKLLNKPIRLNKFSSMGNGYTFPLETLIFHALSLGCCEVLGLSSEFVSTYGDDIIVPVAAAELLTKVLHCVGFKVNKKKSFTAGPFRESCGSDYYLGTDIRPFYIRGQVSPELLFSLHNFFKRKLDQEVCDYVIREIPDHLRLFGPPDSGDGHLIGDHARVRRASHLVRGWGGYVYDTFVSKGCELKGSFPGDRVFPAYSVYLLPEAVSTQPRRSNYLGLREYALAFSDSPSRAFTKGKYQASPLPGTSGYKRISVYTFG